MSWTHAQCKRCWDEENPNREPVKIADKEVEICCTCGERTASGIYIRRDPKYVLYTKGSK